MKIGFRDYNLNNDVVLDDYVFSRTHYKPWDVDKTYPVQLPPNIVYGKSLIFKGEKFTRLPTNSIVKENFDISDVDHFVEIEEGAIVFGDFIVNFEQFIHYENEKTFDFVHGDVIIKKKMVEL